MPYSILIVDDDEYSIQGVQTYLESKGYKVITCTTAVEALHLLKTSHEVIATIVLDYKMPDKSGAELAKEILAINPDIPIAMYSGDKSREALKESLLAGAIEFIEKDQPPSVFLSTIQNLCRKFEETCQTATFQTPQSTDERLIRSIGLAGKSSAMIDVAKRVLKYRTNKENVLILGETGTGKELLAKALHEGPDANFFAVNCAAFQGNIHLLESELFGYEKGAFTGADSRKIGILEAANGGTVFFDEIHQLNPEGQAKLLRVFQEKKIRRLGGHREYQINFRIVAAAKQDLLERTQNKQFLPDLFYRLNVLQVTVPSLAERPSDIEPLVALFTERYNQKTNQSKRFLMQTVRRMEKYAWPGNVRELENTVTQLLTDINTSRIEPKHLDSRFFDTETLNSVNGLNALNKKHEEEVMNYIKSVLKASRSKTEAADKMGIPESTLRSRMAKYGISDKVS